MLVFVNYAQFRKKCRNYASIFYFKFGKNTSIKSLYALAVADSNRAFYAHALSPVERVLGHFLCDPGHINVTISRQKEMILLLKFACNTDRGPKILVA